MSKPKIMWAWRPRGHRHVNLNMARATKRAVLDLWGRGIDASQITPKYGEVVKIEVRITQGSGESK